MDTDLVALVSVAATTLVTSMTTDSWEQVKTAFVRLWQRKHPEQSDAVHDDLVIGRSQVIAARTGGDSQIQDDLLTEWRSRLRRLVEGNEQLQGELKGFAEEFRYLLSEPGAISPVVMQATVHDFGRVNQAGHDQTVISG